MFEKMAKFLIAFFLDFIFVWFNKKTNNIFFLQGNTDNGPTFALNSTGKGEGMTVYHLSVGICANGYPFSYNTKCKWERAIPYYLPVLLSAEGGPLSFISR